ncbi:RNA-binding protein 47 [Nephila pilipes]|uniref:RNA-binding protein 47 n=1 Tax=Nephila pilipes TaxID=299642 RepID=A0A8X6UGH7_NEPPI|nr:RNA-binding protein 47 [Nephila pilipes]
MTQQVITGSPPKSKEEAIAKLLESTGYEITNENGQRKYGPKDTNSLVIPSKGSEVFVGKLPRDVFEDELVPLFEKLGPIYEMRLMMDYGTSNRGFAFVMYTCPEDAKKAIDELNNYEIRKGKFLGVCKSVDNCRLFVGGIPKDKTKDEILEEMQKVTDAVSKVILYSSIADKSKNRGFAFVEYENHKAAAMARRKLIPGKIPLWGHNIAVDWAEPEPDVDEETMSKVTILYARNLMMTTTEEKIKKIFSLDDSVKVEKVKKLRDFAFVHYKTRDDAEVALEKLNNIDIDGSIVEVTWAKPADRITRARCHSRPSQHIIHDVPGMTPYLYTPAGFEPYNAPMPLANFQGRSGMIPRVPVFRNRPRGAAGMRYRHFGPNANRPIAFKPTEVAMAGPPSHFGQYPSNKLGKISEKGEQYTHDYMFLPMAPSAEGLETPIAVTGPPLLPHGPHARVGHPYMYPPPPGYDEMPYFAYVTPGPLPGF